MSVVSKNPFDLLGDDGDESPAPKPTTPSTTGTAVQKAPNAQEGNVRNIPGAGRGGRGVGGRGRGSYPGRGGMRRNDDSNGPRNTGPVPESGNMEGTEQPGGFEGERVDPPKRAHQGPDKHTRGPRPDDRVFTSGGHRARGAGHMRGARTPAFGGERRQFERRSGGVGDSQKKVEQGWGGNDGEAELTAETEGEKDAIAEETVVEPPVAGAAEGDDGGWGAPEEPTSGAIGGFGDAPAPAVEETPVEPEEIQKSLDQYLAERAQASLGGIGKKEARTVESDKLEGQAFVREGIDEFFHGKEKGVNKSKAPKKEKVYIEVDGQFANPAGQATRGSGERGRGGRGGRGRGEDRGEGRGGARFEGRGEGRYEGRGEGRFEDRGEGRGRGGLPRGGRGRGAPRGGRGGFGGGPTNVDSNDEKAFPALGA